MDRGKSMHVPLRRQRVAAGPGELLGAVGRRLTTPSSTRGHCGRPPSPSPSPSPPPAWPASESQWQRSKTRTSRAAARAASSGRARSSSRGTSSATSPSAQHRLKTWCDARAESHARRSRNTRAHLSAGPGRERGGGRRDGVPRPRRAAELAGVGRGPRVLLRLRRRRRRRRAPRARLDVHRQDQGGAAPAS